MCGISGFNWGDNEMIFEMNRALKHRGPDGDGFFVSPEISLGHTRLAILDLSERGKQPMANSDGTVVVSFNGEIYNFLELRDDLRKLGYAFKSNSDTEVIISAYEAWGIDCVKKFNGIFAIALWDAKKNVLYLIRDHIGVKPLYYFWDGQRLVFSSEIKAILSHKVQRAVDADSLNIYFRMLYVPAPRTMFRNIFKVEPGAYIEYKNKAIKTHRYWNPDRLGKISSRQDALDKIRTLMKDSVKRQLISERSVGVFLSGGIDSTAVLGIASECLNKCVDTFSAGFDVLPEKFNADLELAKKTSEHYGTRHHELIVTGADCAKYLQDVVGSMDEPVANATQVATYLLSRFARQNIVVALGGDGGDELFGGYERYKLSRFISLYQRLPRQFRTPVSSFFARVFSEHKGVLKMEIPPGVSRYLTFMSQKENDISRVLQSSLNNANITISAYDKQYFEQTTSDYENDLMYADVRSWLPDESLARSDKLSMAFALEQRVPILDYRLVELSFQIPSSWKMRCNNTKSIFKEAMRSYLPANVLNQPKRGWFSPSSSWLRREVKPLMEEVLSPSFASGTSEFLNLQSIRDMFGEHVSAKAYHRELLWAVLTFQLWYRRYFL